jgi:glycosyltransferase involved in cell wall biosynthesis
MNKLLVIYQDNCGGETKATVSLVNHLKKMNHVDILILPSYDQIGFLKYLYQLSHWWLLFFKKSIKNKRYSWIISPIPQSLVLPIIFRPFHKGKIGYIYQGNRLQLHNHPPKSLTYGQRLLATVDHELHAYVLRKINVFIPSSKSVLSLLNHQHLPIPPHIVPIPNGFINENSNLYLNRSILRKRWHISKSELVICYVGRLDPIKGVDKLIQALAAYEKSWGKCIIAYPRTANKIEHDYEVKIRKIIKKSNISSQIIMVCNHHRIEEIYTIADICILPSYQEVFPLVMLESCRSGCLFVGTNQGEMKSFLRKTPELVIPLPHEPDFNQKIKVIIEMNQQKRDDLANTQQKKALAYSWKNIGKMYDAVFNDSSKH